MAKKIYIDPGHGGTDPGATGFGAQEADIVLTVSKYLQTELKRQGLAVKMSREKDIAKSLSARCSEANTWGADVVVPIHCNAHADASASGTETWIYKTGGNAENLAKKVQPNLVSALGTKNRGIKEGNLAMVRDTKAPAILIELAFITNKADNAKLVSAAYQKKAAVAICKGICSYLGISYKEETKKATTKDKLKKKFKDASSIPAWAEDEVLEVVEKGLMVGDDKGKFNPNATVTRAQLAVILARLK